MHKILTKLLRGTYALYCRFWNRQYYRYEGIHRSVVFAPAFPGLIQIMAPEKCSIGKGSVLNAASVIHCAGGVTIGSNVHIGHGLCIYSSNHNYLSNQSIPYDKKDIVESVVIEDCVWIGANVSIVPGVTIGEGAVVGMSAVVSRNVPSGAIVVGNPAKVIGYRDLKTYAKLKNEGKFC